MDHYVKALEKVAQEKTIEVKTKRNLIEVVTNNKKAIFELLGDDSKPTGVTEEIEVTLEKYPISKNYYIYS